MKLKKLSFSRNVRLMARLALAGLLLLSIILLPAGAQAGRNAAGKDPLWGASLNDLPGWLRMADSASQLYSEYELRDLAGNLIMRGTVNAADCPGSGLMTDGSANACGIERSLAAAYAWQNQFNSTTLEYSH